MDACYIQDRKAKPRFCNKSLLYPAFGGRSHRFNVVTSWTESFYQHSFLFLIRSRLFTDPEHTPKFVLSYNTCTTTRITTSTQL